MLKYNPDERISAEDALKHKFFDPIRHLYYHWQLINIYLSWFYLFVLKF